MRAEPYAVLFGVGMGSGYLDKACGNGRGRLSIQNMGKLFVELRVADQIMVLATSPQKVAYMFEETCGCIGTRWFGSERK